MHTTAALILNELKSRIPSLSDTDHIEQVTKGFSFDAKYFLSKPGSSIPTYVLRTAPIEQAEKKRHEFELVGRVYELGVATSKPVSCGKIDTLQICYMLLGYVQGEDASDVLPDLTEDEQYQVGWQAGCELKRMHELPAPPRLDNWHDRRLAKHRRQFEAYRQCGVKLPEEEAIVAFIEANSEAMQGRPDRFQHDDFHPANLLVQHRAYSGVIDFNRYDWGDPYHDFLKIAYFSREASIPFCIGQIQGYFDGEPSEEFWRLYTLYSALIMFGTVTWTLQVIPDHLDSMLERIRTVLSDHRGLESLIPTWYKPR
ncbi:phosphotransferase family protein [Paenibacillus koleovorans]|uniref:phosphotransferase family protein n=1 Tax=Paenibacillus koleovorans TaxID=121608 RepID=UPI0013E3EBE3|nr:phosphotransferase [Paenibacillus koleovorans]